MWGNSNNGLMFPSGLTNCVSIAGKIIALLEDGRVVAWGDNQLGQLNIYRRRLQMWFWSLLVLDIVLR